MMQTIFHSLTDVSLMDVFLQIGFVGYAILIILAGFSIFSWAVVFYKFRKLRQIQKESQKFLELYQENSDLGEVYAACVSLRTAPVVRLFKAGYLELQRIRKEIMTINMERKIPMEVVFPDWIEDLTSVLQETIVRETALLERLLIFLAITSSSAPLLGLLGTVWGVMAAFWSVGMQGYTSLSVIAPGVSAALVTTIAGLVTAIPAAIFYNMLINRIKSLSAEIECFASGFTNVVRRELRKAL